MFFSRLEKSSYCSKSNLTLLFIGILFFLAAFSIKNYQEYQRNIPSFSQLPIVGEQTGVEDLPERIFISKTEIDLPITPARVINNQWEISDKGVSYLLGSGIPGKKGNVIIYGHNKNHLFGPIRWLENGDEIKIRNKKGKEFIYKVAETKIVSKKAVEVLSPTEDATLTLYTCTGLFDRERFVVVAKLQF